MADLTNQRLVLKARPEGVPDSRCFALETDRQGGTGLEPGQVIVAVTHLSIDPAMRGWMTDAPSYVPPVAIGETMRAFGAGRVVRSRSERFPEGTEVTGSLGCQTLALRSEDELRPIPPGADAAGALGMVGVTGQTAYFGFFDIGRPVAGDMVVVTGAGGAVGSTVVQLAKLAGCSVVAVADSPEKCAWLAKLGADAAIDQTAPDWRRSARAACKGGIDILFDGVGGEALDGLLWHINLRARVVLCGAISQYNATRATGPGSYVALITKRARMEGFLLQDYAHRTEEAERRLSSWLREGRLTQRTTIYDGLEQVPDAIAAMFSGDNVGKTLIRIA